MEGAEKKLFVKNFIDWSVYAVVRVLISLIQALPLSAFTALAPKFAWFFWNVLKVRRQVVEENLTIAFPEASSAERQQIALGMWEHLLLMIAEIAHAPRKIHRTNWQKYMTMPRMRETIRLFLNDRPLVLISGHLGNFEMGGYILGLHGFSTHTIARPLDNPYLNRFINRFRGATGQYMLPKIGSSRQIALLLEGGGCLVLLGDQYAGNGACWVEFFGRKASTHKAVAVFTLSADAPTVICGVLRTGGPLEFEMCVGDIIDPIDPEFQLGSIQQLTQWYTNGLERLVRTAPEQYWWVHRRWKGEPIDRRTIRRQRREHAA